MIAVLQKSQFHSSESIYQSKLTKSKNQTADAAVTCMLLSICTRTSPCFYVHYVGVCFTPSSLIQYLICPNAADCLCVHEYIPPPPPPRSIQCPAALLTAQHSKIGLRGLGTFPPYKRRQINNVSVEGAAPHMKVC